MLVFIDESGIHKAVGRSAIVLVYVMLKNVEKIDHRIIEIEKELKIKPFHWKEQRRKMKKSFFSKAASLPFWIKVAILKNPINIAQKMGIVLKY